MNITMRLYQAGLERGAAVARGADAAEFDRLEGAYKGASIPVHVLHGFKPTTPYSCEYHTGGVQGALLRTIIKEST